VAGGGDPQHGRDPLRRRLDLADQPVALAEQKVADVQRNRHAVLGVHGGLLVAGGVGVLDVVVDQRGLVEALHGDRQPLQIVRQLGRRILLKRPVGAGGEERPPALAVAVEPRPGDLLGLRLGRTHQAVQRLVAEPGLDLLPHAVEVHAVGLVVAGEVDHVPDPLQIDVGVLAVILEQRDGDAGDGGGLHVGEGPLQHGEAGDADDRLDLPRLDDLHHQGRALGDEHGVAEPLGLLLEVLERALPALLAQQAEFVERGLTDRLLPQALGHQQQAALVGHGGEVVAPQLVVDQHGGVLGVQLVEAVLLQQRQGVLPKLLERERGHGLMLGDVLLRQPLHVLPLLEGRRDVVLHFAVVALGRRRRRGHLRKRDFHMHCS
jgi:hypothetical protein